MKFTRGQKETLDLMGVSSQDFCDGDLQDFFGYTDRGIKPKYPSPVYFDLLGRFQAVSITAKYWREDFQRGVYLFPQDFYEERPVLFGAARRADIEVQGFERSIWRIMAYGRSRGMTLDDLETLDTVTRNNE